MRNKWSTFKLLVFLFTMCCGAIPARASYQADPPTQPESIENSVGMRLVKIMPGEFLMGSPETEPSRFECERQHKVRITKAFWISVEEVSVEQYSTVLNREIKDALDGNLPVRHISWHDAESFCRKLSEFEPEKLAGRNYRLPTEAEWEYACRAGTKTAYFWGDDPSAADEYAWNMKNSGESLKRAGGRKPNPWGLHDMNGSLWEWCSDWYAELPSQEQTDPQGTSSGEQRVVRGGAYDSPLGYIRSASRAPAPPSFLSQGEGQNIGFRVVMQELERNASDSDQE